MPRHKDESDQPNNSTPDPLVSALFAKLPAPGSVWPEQDRQAWLAMMGQAFKLSYKETASQ